MPVVLLVSALLAACGGGNDVASGKPKPSPAFCDAAARYDQRVQVAALPEQIRLVRRIAATAPPDVRPDANRFLAALERVRTDRSVVDNPRVKAAVQRVNRRAAQDCGWYARSSGL